MPPSRLEQRDVARDRHDTWGGDAMDVVLASDEREPADVKSCGPGTPMLVSRDGAR